jgi:hypothetical protein
MLDIFSPRKSFSYLSKDADLDFRKDEVFRSDPFSLHVIKQLIYSSKFLLNPLNAESNRICHLLVLLGDLTFMGPCIVSIFQYTCISNKMQRYTVYLFLETDLHVSGATSTHHQKRIQTGSNSSTIAADSSNGVTNTRCCRYSCMGS